MFRGLINDAKVAAGSLIGKYLARASVAVPFLVALGFGVAAITVLLIDKFGHLSAYLMLAGGFAAIGLVATLIVSVKEQQEEIADTQAEAADTEEVATDAAVQAAIQAPLALVGTLLATPAGPSTLAAGAKLVARNLPLAVLLVLIGMLLWPAGPTPQAEAEETDDVNGARHDPHAPVPNGLHREAA
jgi:hypothetical protein